jgi:hypothetical protein
MPFLVILTILLILPVCAVGQETYTVNGTVLDSQSEQALIGASVRLASGKRGTFTNKQGIFHLTLPFGAHTIIVSSLGYKNDTVLIRNAQQQCSVRLVPAAIKTERADVVEEIPVEVIMRRTIERKQANVAAIKTVSGTLYSKLSVQTLSDSRNVLSDFKRLTRVQETISQVQQDFVRRRYFATITQRRQSANPEASPNTRTIVKFINLYDDVVEVIQAQVISPLAANASAYYNYTLLKRIPHNESYIYVVRVEPKPSTVPLLEGVLHILEGSYNLVEARLQIGKHKDITFVDSIAYTQRFSELADGIWYPTYLQTDARSTLRIDNKSKLSLAITSLNLYSDVSFNKPLPDSVPNGFTTRIAADADERVPLQWKLYAPIELSHREQSIYDEQGEAPAQPQANTKCDFCWQWTKPILDFNRTSSLTAGAEGTLTTRYGVATPSAAYSFGMPGFLWNLQVSIPILDTGAVVIGNTLGFNRQYLGVSAEAYSRVSRIGNEAKGLDLNTWLTETVLYAQAPLGFHEDYFDYFKRIGTRLSVDWNNAPFSASLVTTLEEHTSLKSVVMRSALYFSEDKPFRPNPVIEDGRYATISATARYGNYQPAFLLETPNQRAALTAEWSGFVGKRWDADVSATAPTEAGLFAAFDTKIHWAQPTFFTGFTPMMLNLVVRGGVGTANLPLQYQYTWIQRQYLIPRLDQFYTVPFGLYGGTFYASAHLDYNTSDLLWRTLRLPLYNGRGLELIALGGIGYMGNANPQQQHYSTTDGIYAEAGLAIGKIPTFVSDVIMLRFEAVCGIGNVTPNTIRFNLRFSSPL